MPAYETLRLIWWLIIGLLLIGFAVSDGYDLGIGASYRFIGRSDAERRALLLSFEPVWEGNQVWFILGGGSVFAAWPLLYAASFSGLYLAMFLLLLALILRPVGFGYRNQLTDPRWRAAWDWALTVGGALPSLLFGVAFGNLFLGLPFDFDGLQRPVSSGGFFSLLQPFALLTGVVSLTMIVLHGACYAAAKVGEPMASRAAALGRVAAVVYLLAFIGAGLWLKRLGGDQIVGFFNPAGPSDPLRKTVEVVAGGWLGNFQHWPWLKAAPLTAIVAVVAAHLLLRWRHARAALVASALVQAGTILTAGFALFPFLLPSSRNPSHGLTIWDASSSAKTLGIMLGAIIVFMPIILAYTAWVHHVLRGRITLESLHEHEGHY